MRTDDKPRFSNWTRALAGLLAAAAICVLPRVVQAQSNVSDECRELMQARLLNDAGTSHDRLVVVGANVGTNANRPVSLVTSVDYDYLSRYRIGVGDVRPAQLDASGSSAYYGTYKEVQTHGNLPHHNSWSTESALYIDAYYGVIYTRSLTWNSGWRIAENVSCHPGLSNDILVSFQPEPRYYMTLTMRPMSLSPL